MSALLTCYAFHSLPPAPHFCTIRYAVAIKCVAACALLSIKTVVESLNMDIHNLLNSSIHFQFLTIGYYFWTQTRMQKVHLGQYSNRQLHTRENYFQVSLYLHSITLEYCKKLIGIVIFFYICLIKSLPRCFSFLYFNISLFVYPVVLKMSSRNISFTSNGLPWTR